MRFTIALLIPLAALGCSDPVAPLLPLDGTYLVALTNGQQMPARFDGREDGCEHYDVLAGDLVIREGSFTARLQTNKVCNGATIFPAPITTWQGDVSRTGSALTFSGDDFGASGAHMTANGGIWLELAGEIRSDTLEYVRDAD